MSGIRGGLIRSMVVVVVRIEGGVSYGGEGGSSRRSREVVPSKTNTLNITTTTNKIEDSKSMDSIAKSILSVGPPTNPGPLPTPITTPDPPPTKPTTKLLLETKVN